jgi:hypothetical protein
MLVRCASYGSTFSNLFGGNILKIAKALTGACILAAIVLPVAAQQLTTSREALQQATQKKTILKPKYLVVFGKILARTDENGMTRFSYQNGRLISEVLPNGVVGTYQYDSGKFTGVVYTDGRYITVAYNSNGALSGLTTNTSARVRFSVKAKPTHSSGFAAIQRGMSALRNPSTSNYCVGTDDDTTCTIIVEDTPPLPSGGGGSHGGDGWVDELPAGEGEGTIHPPANETPEQCKENVCEGAKRNMDTVCQIATKNPRSLKLCQSKNMEFYSKCLRSCETGDWSWMESFNYIWE